MNLLVKNIKSLVQVEDKSVEKVSGNEMKNLPCINDAFVFIQDGKIKDFGEMKNIKMPETRGERSALTEVDAAGRFVFPTWCDSHTHIVYTGTREGEFRDRINGLSYEEIAKRGGGILNSAKKLNAASEEELYQAAWNRLHEIMKYGTGAVEIKSGYGLCLEGELKMLRVIKKLRENSPLTIKSTFLGAHAVPAEFKDQKEKYIDLIINQMLPQIAEEKLADYCDVFCERNYFTKDETIKILKAALKYGIQPKVHANQLSNSGGVQAGVECNAISVDHLEYIGDEEIKILLDSQTMPTLLPGAAFFLNLPNSPARKMIDAGLPVAVATDYNPGSSPCGNMNFMISLLCIQYKMTPEEAINAATLNSAYAMEVNKDLGSIARGKKANFFITKEIPSYTFIPYSFTDNMVEKVFLDGVQQ
ncbi:MAG TPA: imidazolonepropionase [Bacteroidia bacterium]|nr:imidazolonepropionase [Bacteroidia bacterium]